MREIVKLNALQQPIHHGVPPRAITCRVLSPEEAKREASKCNGAMVVPSHPRIHDIKLCHVQMCHQ